MCSNLKETKIKKPVIGYKVVEKNNKGQFVSEYTGLLIKTRKKEPPYRFLRKGITYNENVCGRTMAFKTLKQAKSWDNGFQHIIKVELKGEIATAKLGYRKMWLGRKVKILKVIK